jgi:hypothetical protein
MTLCIGLMAMLSFEATMVSAALVCYSLAYNSSHVYFCGSLRFAQIPETAFSAYGPASRNGGIRKNCGV